MVHIVRVAWEGQLGTIGETEIQNRLSYFSLPRKIVSQDIGLDFYCELLENKSPTNEFYVQAKGTEHFDENWGQSIKKSTIMYWLMKPNPVFLIVYDEPNGNCYWMSIEDTRYDLIDKIFKTDSDKVYITLDRSHALEKGKDKNNEFISKIKADKLSIELFLGRPSFKGEGYVKQIPDPPRNPTEHLLIKENIRQSLYSLFVYSMQTKDVQNAKLYCEFLTKLDPTGHYNHFMWLGQINLGLGEKETAKKNLEQALWICENDPNWPKESMNEIIKLIKQLIEKCN